MEEPGNGFYNIERNDLEGSANQKSLWDSVCVWGGFWSGKLETIVEGNWHWCGVA